MEQAKRQRAKLFSFRYFFYDFMKVTGALPGLIWLRPKWIYETPTAKKRLRNGCIVISNHHSFFDPVYLMYAIWYRRHHFICGKEFFESKYKTISIEFKKNTIRDCVTSAPCKLL